MKAIISSPHLKMKFPTGFGVGEVCGDQNISRKCYVKSAIPKRSISSEASLNQVVEVHPRDITEIPKPSNYEPVEPVEEIPLNFHEPHKTVKMGTTMYFKNFGRHSNKSSKSLETFLPGS